MWIACTKEDGRGVIIEPEVIFRITTSLGKINYEFFSGLGGADSAITPEVQEKIAFLKNSAEPWETVVEYWECTIKCRLNEIDPDSINEYFKTYLALCKPNGHLLVGEIIALANR